MKERQIEDGILTRIAEIFCALFVVFSFAIVSFIFGSISGIKNLDSTGQRLVLGGIWILFAAGIAVAMYFAAGQKPLESFRILEIRDKKQAWLLPAGSAIAFVGGIALNRVVILLVSLIPFPKDWVDKHDEIVTGTTQGNVFVAIIALCVITPIIEELCFRGKAFYYLRKAFGQRLGTFFAVLLTSVLFAVSHVSYIQMIYAFVIGAVFALLSLRSGSVVPSILAHAGFNIANPIFLAWFSNESRENMALMLDIACIVVLIICGAAVFVIGGILRGDSKDDGKSKQDIYIK